MSRRAGWASALICLRRPARSASSDHRGRARWSPTATCSKGWEPCCYPAKSCPLPLGSPAANRSSSSGRCSTPPRADMEASYDLSTNYFASGTVLEYNDLGDPSTVIRRDSAAPLPGPATSSPRSPGARSRALDLAAQSERGSRHPGQRLEVPRPGRARSAARSSIASPLTRSPTSSGPGPSCWPAMSFRPVTVSLAKITK